MQPNIIEHFRKIITLTREEEELIASKIKKRHLKKRELLLEEGMICKHLSYINQGCMRIYSVDDYALEKTIFFSVEDWWAVDLKSFIEFSEARFYIEALTPCELTQIYKNDFEELLERIPKLEKWFRILLQNALISSEDRINYKMSLTAQERYLKFKEKYPILESRISQKHIASYLGISPEFLSSLRTKNLKKKS
ncbi:Crp/Fnr family transcriptional regulator [Aquimarina rhabdastrellae]